MIVHREAKRLGIADFFEGGLFGPGEDWRAFSKLAFTRSMLENANASGEELLGFGDGFVETENAKQLGRTPVGCATDATGRIVRVEEWKRSRLIRAGADLIIPDDKNWPELASLLFAEVNGFRLTVVDCWQQHVVWITNRHRFVIYLFLDEQQTGVDCFEKGP